ncbi:hypothetical protein [Hydrogenophaga sp.]|uniref:hypothetical protein n=1 Tax=Hydrogenophaga sp. TaxID=1904254 RepID=UPI003F6A8E86
MCTAAVNRVVARTGLWLLASQHPLTALGVQTALVLVGGTFMAERVARANTDLVGRLTHRQCWS